MKKTLSLTFLIIIAAAVMLFAEEIKLTAINPGDSVMRSQKGAVGGTWYSPSTLTDGSIPDDSLMVQGKVIIGRTSPLDANCPLQIERAIAGKAIAFTSDSSEIFSLERVEGGVRLNSADSILIGGANSLVGVGVGTTTTLRKYLQIHGDENLTNYHDLIFGAGQSPYASIIHNAYCESDGYHKLTDDGYQEALRFLNGGIRFYSDNRAGSAGSLFNPLSPTLRMSIFSSVNGGSVGIGNVSPGYPLHMAGGAYCSEGGVWTNGSSRAYKQDIAPLGLDNATKALEGLNPVTFRYKATLDEKSVGFIAEDVPELVAAKDRKGLSPMDIVAVLTKVVQNQQKEIEELKAKVRRLKKKR